MTFGAAPPAWGLRRGVAVLLATALLFLVLIQPNHPAAMTWGALGVFPLELPVIILALVAMSPTGVATRILRLGLVLSLTLIAFLKVADFASFTALSRGFNPVSDLALVEASFRLAAGTFGTGAAIGISVLFVIGLAALAAAIWWATGVWSRVTVPHPLDLGSGAAAVMVGALAVMEIGGLMGRWTMPFNPPGAAFTARVGAERVRLVQTTIVDLQRFAEAARSDPLADRPDLFAGLDRDLIIIFVESYGRGALENPLYAERISRSLDVAEAALEDTGLAMRSGWLNAPTRGGQSWLAHMSLASGLRIDGQSRYAAALASSRETLYELASRSGVETVAVMPAITLPWPEGIRMGYDQIFNADDLGYEGLPFNWVTMPDQYTLSAMDRLVRMRGTPPKVVQVALVSSHAPWTPVPDLIPWNDVGDGTIFNEMAAAGDPPDVVWRDRDRVRAQYGLSVDYAVRTAFAWATRQGDDAPIMLILGDHQPAEFVAGDRRPDVPAHLIGPKVIVERAAEWGWSEGLHPSPQGDIDGMEVMRDRLIRLVSPPETIERAAR